MKTHTSATTSMDGDRWQVVCECGWASKWRDTHGQACEDFAVHMELVRREVAR